MPWVTDELMEQVVQAKDVISREMGVNSDAKDQTFITDEVLIKNGTPAEVIVETAQENNCDLIVMGIYGHSTLRDVLVGSTAKWVIKNSPIPVLVIRLP